jgi:hypothetical protein
MAASKYPRNPAGLPAPPASSKFVAAAGIANDTGPQILLGGSLYYRQLDDLSISLSVAKTITDAEWLEYLERTTRLARQIGRMPKATMAAFTNTYPDAKQRLQTRDFLKSHGVKPVERLGLLSDNPLIRGAIVAFSWVVPNAHVLAFGSRDVAKCLEWLHEVASFDERNVSTAWSEARATLRVH